MQSAAWAQMEPALKAVRENTQHQAELDGQIAELRAQLARMEAEGKASMAACMERVDATDGKVEGLDGKVVGLDGRIKALEEMVKSMQGPGQTQGQGAGSSGTQGAWARGSPMGGPGQPAAAQQTSAARTPRPAQPAQQQYELKISGMPESLAGAKLCQAIKEVVSEYCVDDAGQALVIDVKFAMRMGMRREAKEGEVMGPRAVRFKVETEMEYVMLMRAKSMLRDAVRQHAVYIEPMLSAGEYQRFKALLPEYKKRRLAGERVMMSRDKLVGWVKGEGWVEIRGDEVKNSAVLPSTAT